MVNYNNSLTWNKAISGWFPLLTMIPGFRRTGLGRDQIYPDIYIYIYHHSPRMVNFAGLAWINSSSTTGNPSIISIPGKRTSTESTAAKCADFDFHGVASGIVHLDAEPQDCGHLNEGQWVRAAKSQAPVENGGKDPIICRVSTCFNHPFAAGLRISSCKNSPQKPLLPPIPIEKNPPPLWIDMGCSSHETRRVSDPPSYGVQPTATCPAMWYPIWPIKMWLCMAAKSQFWLDQENPNLVANQVTRMLMCYLIQ